MSRRLRGFLCGLALLSIWGCGGGRPSDDPAPPVAPPAPSYRVYVTNETSGDLTVIDGARGEVVATIPLGKRPRGARLHGVRARHTRL